MTGAAAELDSYQLLSPVIDAQLAYIREGDEAMARTIQQEIGSALLDAQHGIVLITQPEAIMSGDGAVKQLVEIIDDHRFSA